MERIERLYGVLGLAVLSVVVLPLLLYFEGFLLFHVLAENLIAIINILLFVIGSRTYRYSKNARLLFIGVAYVYVAALGILHALSYKGMNLISGIDASTATQFWVARRLLESGSLLVASFWRRKECSFIKLNLAFGAITLGFVASIFTKIFPVCFIEGQGLTLFKKLAEYVVILFSLIAIYRLARLEETSHFLFKNAVGWAIVFGIAAEIMFTLYSTVYDTYNVIGHLLYLFSSGLLLVYVVKNGLDKPYDIMFKSVYEKSIRDNLTGLHNRHGLEEMSRISFDRAKRFPATFCLIVMDLDNFKTVNDDFGHAEGDLALVEFARMLKTSFREYDLIARLGGDEFLALLEDGADITLAAVRRLERQIELWKLRDPRREKLGLSYGISIREAGSDRSLNDLISEADAALIQEKVRKHTDRDGSPEKLQEQYLHREIR